MGIQWSTRTSKMMKSILFVALVAAAYAEAEPKADADAFYGTYGYAAPFNGYNTAFNGYNAYAYGARPYGYNAYNYGSYPYHAIGKRSADAEADADAFYGSYGYAAPFNGYNT